jgi:Cu-Zn family superoxide dismutase
MKTNLAKTAIPLCLAAVISTSLAADNPAKAIAVLHPTQGYVVSGTVIFTQTPNGVEVVADVSGLTPGEHGFHIHEYGDCSASDATSAGGHFNPHHMHHAGPEDAERHAGDLGNIIADAQGNARYKHVDAKLGFEGDDSILGHAVIIHVDQDDLKSQPTGDAGGRVACGVIGVAKP